MTHDDLRGGLDAAALRRILDVTRDLARPIDLPSMLAQVIDAGRAVLGADRGTVFLYDAAADELETMVATGIGSVRLPAGRGIVGECVRTRSVVNVPDCYADPRFNREVDRQTGYRTRCLLSVPLLGSDGTLVGVLQLLNKAGGAFDQTDEEIALALAAQCAVALQRVRMTEQLIETERLERELAVAREIQTGFLPKRMPRLPGYEVAALSRPAEETGGDTFDLVTLPENRLGLLLGDATGHGVGPALSATQVRAMLRMAYRLGAGLDTTFVHINNQLCDDLSDGRFVTGFLGILDTASHTIAYHAGGQAPLLHFSAATGACDWRAATTFPMGVFPQRPAVAGATMQLEPGDILGLITDGVFEYQAASGEQYGTDRFERLLREHHTRPLPELIEITLAELARFGGTMPQGDDITMVLVRRM